MKRNKSGCLCITKSRCRISDKSLGLQFLMSDEDKKIFFVIAGYLNFLTCFSLTSHMSGLTLPFLFPFPLYFFLTDIWIQFTLCYLFALTSLSYTFYFSCTHLCDHLHSLQGRSVFFYMPAISNAENFTFHSELVD